MALPLYDPSGTQLTNRQQANQASPDAFGASVGRAMVGTGNQLQRAGDTMLAFAEDQKKKSDATAVIGADAEASARLRKGLYGEGGVFTRTGVNADGMTLTAEELTDTIGKDISGKLTDPAQRLAFDNMWSRRKESTLDAAAKTEFQQRNATATATKTAALANTTADAIAHYNDPDALALDFDIARKYIRANPDGLPAEMVEQMERESISSLHVGVIQRIAQDDPGKALDYYEKHKGQVFGADHAAADKFISTVQNIRAGKQAVDEIANTGAAGSLADAMFHAESGGEADPGAAISSAGALGDAQLMPDTARAEAAALPGLGKVAAMNDDELAAFFKTPDGRIVNRRIGATYLQKQLTRYRGDVEAAIIAYNAGPGNADKFLNSGRDYDALPKKSETLPHVRKVLSKYVGFDVTGETSADIQRSVKGESPQAYYSGDAGEFLKTVLQPQHGADHVDNMNPAMRDRLAALFQAAPPNVRDGLDILSGARTHERQVQLWEQSDKTGKRVARPGHSQHEDRGEGGKAADLGWKGGKFASAPEDVKEWVHANAAAYGLRFPMDYEPWHIETVEARGGKTPKGKASKPNAADVARVKGRFADDLDGSDTRGMSGRVKDDDAGMVELAAAPPGNPADIYSKAVEPFQLPARANDKENWLATARERYANNPSLLAEVERQLGDEYALREAKQANELKALQAEAVRNMMAGKPIREMDPYALQTLGANGKLTPLLEAESKWNREDDATDDATYIRLSKLTPEELAEYDLIQDMDKLSKGDLKSFADKAATFRNDKTGKASAVDRTRTQIMSEAENILALKPNEKQEDAIRLRNLNRALDDQIAIHTGNTGKEPTGKELQEMVDELILEGHVEKSYQMDPAKRVFELTPEERNSVYFATSWNGPDGEGVPTAARAMVGKGYRAMYGVRGDEEGGVAFYNDMMRVRLGGTPSPPEELDAKIRQRLIKSKNGAPPTDEEMAAFYTEWMKAVTTGGD